MTCPNCQQDFILLPDDVPQPSTSNRPGGAVQTRTAPMSMPVSIPQRSSDPKAVVEPPLVVALSAIVMIGIAVVISYIPFGRFVSIVIAPIGIFAAFLSLLSLHERKWLGVVGMAGNALVMLILLVWPGLIGAGNWLPPPDPNAAQEQILSVGRDGKTPLPSTGVDASLAMWQQGDCRLDVTTVKIAPLDPTTKNADQRKVKALKITIQLSNVGVMRPLEIKPLPEPPNEIRLTNSTGLAIARKSIDLAKATTIFPGKSLDIVLTFDVPPEPASELKLELPPMWLGHRDPAVIRIPSSMINRR